MLWSVKVFCVTTILDYESGMNIIADCECVHPNTCRSIHYKLLLVESLLSGNTCDESLWLVNVLLFSDTFDKSL